MRLLTGILAVILLACGALAAQKPWEAPPPDFRPAEITSATEARYPPNTVAAGTVVLQVTVGPAGEVEAVKVIRDIPSLTAAAERALKNWKFKPATLDGRPVRSVVPVAFSFARPVLNP